MSRVLTLLLALIFMVVSSPPGGSGFAATYPTPLVSPAVSAHLGQESSAAEGTDDDTSVALATTWTPQNSGTNHDLRSVEFVSPTEGWVVGDDATVLHTADGGTIWSGVTVPGVDSTRGFHSVWLSGSTMVWLGGRSVLARSVNGGSSWVSATLPTNVLSASNVTFNSIFPVSQDGVWAAGRGELGGDSVGPAVLFLLTASGSLTTDFSSFFGGSGDCQILDVFFFAANNGWLIQANGDVLRFEPVGSSNIHLVFQSCPTSEPLNGIFMLDAMTGWIVGNGGNIFKTTNGGDRWSEQTSGTTRHLRSVSFMDANRGWAVGDGGTILATTNGGTTWTAEPGGGEADLRAVKAVSTDRAFAVGGDGVILVRSVVEPDFSIAFQTATITVQHGTSLQATLNVNRVGGFTGKVTVTAPVTSDLRVKVKPSTASTKGTSLQFTFKAKSTAVTGTHTLTFTGNDKGGRQRTTTVELVVE